MSSTVGKLEGEGLPVGIGVVILKESLYRYFRARLYAILTWTLKPPSRTLVGRRAARQRGLAKPRSRGV